MPYLSVAYDGGQRFLLEVGGHHLVSDQPVEAGGQDAGPTPTELFVTSLAACAAYYGTSYLKNHGLAADGLRVACHYQTTEQPHRVASIDLSVCVPEGLPEDRRAALLRAIDRCTVHNSLRQPPEVHVILVGRAALAVG